MKFTISYLACDRLRELFLSKTSIISPMFDLAPETEGIKSLFGGDIDLLLVSEGYAEKAENKTVPKNEILGFINALYNPKKCVRARLKDGENTADTYFILFDGAWLKADADRGFLTVTAPFSSKAVEAYLRTACELVFSAAGNTLETETREPSSSRRAIVKNENEGYTFVGNTNDGYGKNDRMFFYTYEKNGENEKLLCDMLSFGQYFSLKKKRSYKKAAKGFLIALSVNLCMAIIIAVVRALI